MSEKREALPLSSADPTSTGGGGGGHPRRNLGRSARRRRKKHLELEQLERSLLLLGTTTTAPNDKKKKEVLHEVLSGSCSSSLSVDRHWGGSRIAHLRHERPTQWKSPQDPVALQRQLGYVPGNAIAVATRLHDLYPSSPNNNNNNNNNSRRRRHGPPPLLWPTSNSSSSKQPFQLLATDTPETPVVVQLYPLAWRKEHGGGKAQGCSFKSRKRKRWQQQPLDDNNNNNNGEEKDDTRHTTKGPDTGKDNDPNVPVQGTTSNDSSVPDHEMDDHPNNDTTTTNTTSSTVVVEPFPTMYWLTHPLLKVWVSQLEVQGLGVEFQERLNQDEPSLQRMYRAHQAHGHERLQLLRPTTIPPPLVSSSLQQPQEEKEGEPTDRRQTAQDKDQDNGTSPPNGSSSAHINRIANPITQQQDQEQPQAETEDDHRDESIRRRWSSRLENLGIAGIRNFAAVKCLHAHCAHVLSGGAGSQDNVVGHWVVEALRQRILQQQAQAQQAPQQQTGVVVEAPVHTTTTTTTTTNKVNP